MDTRSQIVLGVLASLLTSFVDALGLNIQKRDHLKESRSVKPRNECMRPQWHFGLFLYIGAQMFGSTVVLTLLKAQWAAPLGAVSLVFNFVFAHYLVGTVVTKRDVFGTMIILSSILIIVLTGACSEPPEELDREKNLSLESLKENFNTLHFKIYFAILNAVLISAFIFSTYARWLIGSESRLKSSTTLGKFHLKSVSRVLGAVMAALGGIIGSETLLLAKSGILLIIDALNGVSEFTDPLSYTIVVFLIVTAIFQIYCLNAGLKLADSVIVVPIFSCTYNVFSLANTMFYFDLFEIYPRWFHAVSALGVILLSTGIFILASQKKEEPATIPSYQIPCIVKRLSSQSHISSWSDKPGELKDSVVVKVDSKKSTVEHV